MTLRLPHRGWLRRLLGAFLCWRRLLLLLLLRLHGGVVDVPDEEALEDHGDENDDEDGEENWLVIEDCDGLGRRTNAGKPVELAHVWSLMLDAAFLRARAVVSDKCSSRPEAGLDQERK